MQLDAACRHMPTMGVGPPGRGPRPPCRATGTGPTTRA